MSVLKTDLNEGSVITGKSEQKSSGRRKRKPRESESKQRAKKLRKSKNPAKQKTKDVNPTNDLFDVNQALNISSDESD